ncbi:MAG: type II secretion system F family protein [Patescibacteria group bacterium]
MPTFSYKAKEEDGSVAEGAESAENKFDLADLLKSRGLTVLNITESKESNINKIYTLALNLLSRITLEDKINFARNIGVMVGSGIALLRALEIELRQSSNKKFNAVLFDIINTVKGGGFFSKALGDHPKIFPKFFKEMVVTGEKSGRLEESLKIVTLQLSKDYALRKKVRGAMIYPMIVFFSMIAIAVLMLVFVVPSLVATFNELNIEIPASTSFIIFIGSFFQSHGFISIAGFSAVLYAFFYFFSTRVGKESLDYFFAYFPLIKGINKKFNAARVCRALSSLISAGVDIVESFDTTRGLVTNHLYQKTLDSAADSIKKGNPISKVFLAGDSLFPPLVGEMIAVGEETGKISLMLSELARFYESEVNTATKELSTVIEPILMIIIGAFVGFFAISMISPMYNLSGGF